MTTLTDKRNTSNTPAPENPADLTEGPPLDIRTGHIIIEEVKEAVKALNKKGKMLGVTTTPHLLPPLQKLWRRKDWSYSRFSTLSLIRSGMRRTARPLG